MVLSGSLLDGEQVNFPDEPDCLRYLEVILS